MKLLNVSSAVLVASILSPISAQAGSYYNCSNVDGCLPIEEVKSTSDYTQTKYPVLLSHGLTGWTRMFNLVDYFHGIPQELMKGGSDVYSTKVSSVNSSEYRGEQLLKQVQTIRAITGKNKVNLIGHSQGGIDIRYVAAVAPEAVASVTAVSSPEQGSKMADWVVKMIIEGSAKSGLPKGEFNIGSKITIKLTEFIGKFMDFGSGIDLKKIQQQDAWKAVNALTTEDMSKFNAKFPAAMPSSYCGKTSAEKVNGIPYYSFSGVGQKTNGFDASDTIMALTAKSFGDDPNDGLVSSCSSHIGKVLRDDYKMNHMDSVNQLVGLTAAGETKPTAVYRVQVNRIKKIEDL